MTEKLVDLIDVSLDIRGRELLANINLSVGEGESLGILGKSGSGKSALLSMIRGDETYKPTKGKMVYHVAICPSCEKIEPPGKAGQTCTCGDTFIKKDIDFWSDKNKHYVNLIKQRIAIMLQRTFNLYGSDTVLENIMKPLLERNYTSADAVNKSVELLTALNMVHRTLYIANDLSGGEKQRVVLARQLAMEPVLLLADEPTGTLDPKTAMQVESTIQANVKDGHRTMVLTSHWYETVKRLTTRAILLDKGKIVAEGSPEDVIKNYLETGEELEEREVEHIGSPIIDAKDIKKYYYSLTRGIVKAVDGVSFAVNENEIFGIVGMSGAGKTTLSKILAGLAPEYAGYKGYCQMRVGEDWVNMGVSSPGRGRAKEHMAVLHQEYGLFSFKTVRENLTGAVPDLPDELAKFSAEQTMEAVGFEPDEIDGVLDRMPADLSEGERQRAIFALALIQEPRILILDEPTGTMDPITRATVANTVKRVRTELDTTIIVISHDIDFVKTVCDRVAFMSLGKIEKIGTPEEAIEALYEKEEIGGKKNE